MRRKTKHEASSDIRLFWAVHRAASAIMSEDGADSANEYIEALNEITHGPKPPSTRQEIDDALRMSGF
jgi:hypothetical protein